MKPALAALLIVCVLSCASGPSTPDEKDAATAAEQWLTLTDSGKYAESYTQAAAAFRTAISQKSWEQQIRAARAPLGELESRSVKSATYTRTLPGAPDGEYVVIQFNTSFGNKKSAIETVTPMKDSDGQWRVSGYYIK